MFKYLLGILTALIFVAAFVVWTSLPGNIASDSDSSRSGGGATTRGLALTPGAVAMRREIVQRLGFGIDLPGNWRKLDEPGMRKMLSEYQGVVDERVIDASVKSMVLATVRDWPEQGPEPGLTIYHDAVPERDVLQILQVIVDQKRLVVADLEMIKAPRIGVLGGFTGGSVRTRDKTISGTSITTEDTVMWVLRVADGYLIVSATAPSGDTKGLAMIERMLKSFSQERGT